MFPTVLSVVAATMLSGVLCVLVTPFINYFLPKYKEAIPIIYILSLSMPVLALGLPTSLLRTALRYGPIYLVGIVKVFSVLISVILLPKTIVWISMAVVIGELVDVGLAYFFLLNHVKHEKKVL